MNRRQSGFTLIELLAASAATAVIILASTAFMLKALAWFDELSAKIEMNRHARETFSVLAFGGQAATNGNDGTKNLYGIRGFQQAPGSGLRSSATLQYASNNLTLTPDKFASMSVPCTGVGTPIPDCASAGSAQTVTGWIGKDIQMQAGGKSINGLTVNVTFTITDPFQAQRAKGPAAFTDTYRTVFTLNRKENNP
jgi:prepilin-type N-terminal cleavage/methylation domain-containing protein